MAGSGATRTFPGAPTPRRQVPACCANSSSQRACARRARVSGTHNATTQGQPAAACTTGTCNLPPAAVLQHSSLASWTHLGATRPLLPAARRSPSIDTTAGALHSCTKRHSCHWWRYQEPCSLSAHWQVDSISSQCARFHARMLHSACSLSRNGRTIGPTGGTYSAAQRQQ